MNLEDLKKILRSDEMTAKEYRIYEYRMKKINLTPVPLETLIQQALKRDPKIINIYLQKKQIGKGSSEAMTLAELYHSVIQDELKKMVVG